MDDAAAQLHHQQVQFHRPVMHDGGPLQMISLERVSRGSQPALGHRVEAIREDVPRDVVGDLPQVGLHGELHESLGHPGREVEMAFCLEYLNASVLVSERAMENARSSDHSQKRERVNGYGIENYQEKEYYMM